ncbi:MAG: alkanesulfonate monooxygenase SsuD [Saprospiraceae bacterium]|jgi:alkanesulfonate monooxygenase SsuD/methylene tetrahydromethanopterin reductase-like flavin-dependent oxidoreductase (luciferase family)
MKFQLAINMERTSDARDMRDEQRHNLEMVQKADQSGFSTVWAAEHHALEMTIAPNPFQILTWYAAHTDNIRLGTAVAVAPYWHPIRLAGEAAMADLYSGGRLEFGIGSGAYQREFDRMHNGLKQSEGWKYMAEMLPALQALWKGDYEHDGEYWKFPTATSVPKPMQVDIPVWIAARAPVSFDMSVERGYNIMSWPLTRPMSEAELYKQHLDNSMAKFPGAIKPTFAMMRHTSVYDNAADGDASMKAIRATLGRFANLFQNLGDVENGFPKPLSDEALAAFPDYNPNVLEQNLMFGSPDMIIEKLKLYEALGVDEFIYYASMGLGHEEQKRSLDLFCNEVMPAFA